MTSAVFSNVNLSPHAVPAFTLRGGASLPGIGLGTFGSDRYDGNEVSRSVQTAINMGYRLIDCAAVYDNEPEIGETIEQSIQEGAVKRQDLFIISKVWNDHHGRGDVLLSCVQSLKDLRLDYLDLFLVHWPFRNIHPAGAPPDYHNPDAQPYIHERYMETWYQMERLHRAGFVRHIGTSNMTISKLSQLVHDCTIMPAVNEMELHPSFQQPELFNYCQMQGIQPIGYCPLGSPSRPARDRDITNIIDLDDPVVCQIARNHQIHPAEICLKWAVQRGQIPIPFSVKSEQLADNLQSVSCDPLTSQEMHDLAGVDQDCRLIKGQVFLWDGAKDWYDLWD